MSSIFHLTRYYMQYLIKFHLLYMQTLFQVLFMSSLFLSCTLSTSQVLVHISREIYKNLFLIVLVNTYLSTQVFRSNDSKMFLKKIFWRIVLIISATRIIHLMIQCMNNIKLNWFLPILSNNSSRKRHPS